MKKQLKKAYKRLDIISCKGIIKDTLVPYLDDYDGEYVTTLTPATVFTIEKHYHEGMLMGWNIKADGVLLETKSTKRKAVKFLKLLSKGKKKRFISKET
ncbi:MAG TPA: hypothetical protein DEQ02_08080 [Ruminococcaceae bacterium]|nr:hypothetical protein [Oscillospiraceae bacterium]